MWPQSSAWPQPGKIGDSEGSLACDSYSAFHHQKCADCAECDALRAATRAKPASKSFRSPFQ
jgi:hypothetical protein